MALTANAMQGDRDQCLGAGMTDYLSKPFILEGLRRVLTQWLRARPGVPAGRSCARSRATG